MDRSPPPAIVPTPAAQFARLRGRRVIVGVPGLGFRGDLRADDPVIQDGRTYVPVLTEQDYYRAEIEEIEAIAPLVPVDRVWVEHIPAPGEVSTVPEPLDAPPWNEPTPASAARLVLGRRLIQAVPDGHIRNLRAATHVYQLGSGTPVVRVCGELEWYTWAISGQTPSTVEIRAQDLWVE
jgi:hypothetical protein